MSLYTSYYTWSNKGIQTDYDSVACFRQAISTFNDWDELYINIFKKYESWSDNDAQLKYDTYDIESWIGFLRHCRLKCELYLEDDKKYVILLKKEDYINKNHFLMCCQCIRYLYERPKTDIPRQAMRLRQQYNLFDPMECLLMAHYANRSLYYSREHSMIVGIVKLQNLWETIENLEVRSSLHTCFNTISEYSEKINEMNDNLMTNRLDKIIAFSNEYK